MFTMNEKLCLSGEKIQEFLELNGMKTFWTSSVYLYSNNRRLTTNQTAFFKELLYSFVLRAEKVIIVHPTSRYTDLF